MGTGTGLEERGGVFLLDRDQALSTAKVAPLGDGGEGQGAQAGGGLPCSKPLLCHAQVCLLPCTLLSSLLLLLVCSIHETEQNSYCQQIITEKHLAELEELVSALPGLCCGTGARLGLGRRKSALI